jgi:predicted dehydrogenase
MRKVRTAVIGLGRISWIRHIPQLLQHSGFEIVGLMDPLQERLEEAAKNWSITNLYRDYDKLLQELSPELVVIASPTNYHKEQIIKAFQYSCNVFSDKPIALSLAETDEIISAMNRYSKKLMVYQPKRLDLDCISARDIIESKKLGKIHMLKRTANNFNRRCDWQALLRYGGGMLNNYGAHFIDQILSLLKDEIVHIDCTLKKIVSLGDADDFVKVILETKNNVTVDLEISQACSRDMDEWFIAGDQGCAYLETSKNLWDIKYMHSREAPNISLQNGLAARGREYNGESIVWHEENVNILDYKADNFYDKCYDYYVSGKPPFVSVYETRNVMNIIQKCRENNNQKILNRELEKTV